MTESTEPRDRIWVNEERTVIVWTSDSERVAIALRDHPSDIWCAPVWLSEET